MSLTQTMAVGCSPFGEQGARGEAAAIERVGVGGGAHLHAGVAGGGFEDGAAAFIDGAEQGVVADEAEFAMAKAVEVVDHFVDAAAVIHADVGDVLAGRADVVEDHRDGAVGEFVHQGGLHFGDHGGEAGDAAADHQADGGDELFAAIVGVGDDDFEARRLVRIAFDGFEDVEEEGVLHIGDDHADGAAFSAREIAGVQIGVILEFLDGLDDAGAGGGLDHACIIEHARDRGGGDFGAAGHLFKVHVANIVQEIRGI